MHWACHGVAVGLAVHWLTMGWAGAGHGLAMSSDGYGFAILPWAGLAMGNGHGLGWAVLAMV
jgi:hypothetical protein